MPTHYHLFTLDFGVSESNEPSGDDCIKNEIDKVLRSLKELVSDLEKCPGDAANYVRDLGFTTREECV